MWTVLCGPPHTQSQASAGGEKDLNLHQHVQGLSAAPVGQKDLCVVKRNHVDNYAKRKSIYIFNMLPYIEFAECL